jgi:hypothetical protein
VSARDDWEVAAEDAGIEPDAVFLVEARSKDGSYGAMRYPPGMWALPGEDAFELTAEVH